MIIIVRPSVPPPLFCLDESGLEKLKVSIEFLFTN